MAAPVIGHDINVRPPWHAISAGAVLHRIGSCADGLTDAEASLRLSRHGRNVFRSVPPVSVWTLLFSQLRSIIVLLLLVAALIALLVGDALDALAIALVLVLNIALGFVTELRASRAMEALLRLEVSRATVVRDRQVRSIDARDLVPGDLIEVEAGQTAPADARLIEATELRVAEAALTGESLPADKNAHASIAADSPLSDRRTMIYKATNVVAGRARAVVVATGMETEVGKVGQLAEAVRREPTLLERRLDDLGRSLVGIAIGVAIVVAALGLRQNRSWTELVQTAIALAVAAVPEGLPVVGTIALAVGTWRMARRCALIRRLPVVESLGSATVICTDKTGTLTAGDMTVTVLHLAGREVQISGSGYTPEGEFIVGGKPVTLSQDVQLAAALRIASLTSRADVVLADGEWKARGDPTEVALTIAARKGGLERSSLLLGSPEVAEIPFSSERMLMATFHRTPASVIGYVKGAPGKVLELTTQVLTTDGIRELRPGERDELLEQNHALARRGLRVIALAMKQTDHMPVGDLSHLVWVGLAGLIDPPAPGVAETIHALREAGIRTVMVTGDQRLTAASIARQLGLMQHGEHTLDGREVDQLSNDALVDAVQRTVVFSRVSPEAKLRIVGAYQQRGEIVAMLGDGVNDAAALRKANVGVAMGKRGTDLAKEAADVILEDDRFTTVVAAVEEGRVIFDNIRKFVFYLFSCNLAEILVMLGAGLAGLPVPLRPIQILWLNLLTDTLPALALAVEPGENAVMQQPPRDPKAPILSGTMIRAAIGYGALIAVCALGVFGWGLLHAGSVGQATTMTFMTLALAQILHLGNARGEGPVLSLRRALANRFALAAAAVAVVLQLLPVLVPVLTRVLAIERLDPREWLLVGALAILPALVGQGIKTTRMRLNRLEL
jgi:P-type Ca2+ transporter type 2C